MSAPYDQENPANMGFWERLAYEWRKQSKPTGDSVYRFVSKHSRSRSSQQMRRDRNAELERMRMDGVREKQQEIKKRMREQPHYAEARALVLDVYADDPYDCLGFNMTPLQYEERIKFALQVLGDCEMLTWRIA